MNWKRRLPDSLYSDLVASGILLAWLTRVAVLNSNDGAWHIATGRLIRSLGHLPATDPWSYVSQGAPWYNLAWVFDVAASWIWDVLGPNAAFIALLAAFIALLPVLGKLAMERGADRPVVLFMGWAAGCILAYGLSYRPHVVTTWLTLAFFIVLTRDRTHLSARYFWALPVLMVIWVNSHGGFLAGPVVIAAFAAEALYQREWLRARRLIVCGGLVMLATLVNPYGYTIYLGMYRTLGQAITKHIQEWLPFNAELQSLFLVFFLLILVPFRPTDKRIPLAEKLLVLVWVVMSMKSLRHLYILAVVATPCTAYFLSQMLRNCRYGAWYIRYVEKFDRDKNTDKMRLSSFAAAAALVLIVAIPQLRPFVWSVKDWQGYSYLPTEEVEYVRKHYPGARFITDLDTGGYLLFAGHDVVSPFFDGRTGTAYPESVVYDYTAMATTGTVQVLEDVRKKYHAAGYFVVKASMSKLSMLSRVAECQPKFIGPTVAVVICENSPRQAPANNGVAPKAPN